ncbi:hypothetical protein CWI37_0246p0040 [Hamiltosporidium tvaerminnensis]|uniref:Leucine-rich repeat-containing protein n=2 Tax=Hamiltosporidium TaxID=1176354 RepID=A0A4Q9L811_9MICR|nr:hypothetical protein CWI37_0246p0040 [Hamiltosporidium tvaerminnensis]
MPSIKGPRSALTDFIEESGIDIKQLKKRTEQKETNEINEIDKSEKEEMSGNNKIIEEKICKKVVVKRKKIIKIEQPYEILNLENTKNRIFELPSVEFIDDLILEKYSFYLSKNKLMDLKMFKFLVENSKESLVVYDCSNILDKDYLWICKNYSRLELHYCGQLTEKTLNDILMKMKKLDILKITGAFLLHAFKIPKTIKSLDLSNCSRIKDSIFKKINKLQKLEELRLSYCYSLTEKCRLTVSVKRLFICQTKISQIFFSSTSILQNLEVLSVKKCPNFFSVKILEKDEERESKDDKSISFLNKCEYFIEYLKNIQVLDLDGISTIKFLVPLPFLISLNISNCFCIQNIIESILKNKNIEEIDLSRLEIEEFELKQLILLKKLRKINLSWIRSVNDDILTYLINNLPNITHIYVFGCFKLSPKLGELSWEIKEKVKIIGNPSETAFLLNSYTNFE